MVKFSTKHIALLLISMMILSGTVFSQKKKKGDDGEEQAKIEFQYFFLEAKKQMMLGDYTLAAGTLGKCLQLNSKSAVARYELAKIYMLKEDYYSALNLTAEAVKLNESNKWYRMQLAFLYQQTGASGKALKEYEKLINAEPRNLEYNYNYAGLLLKTGKVSKAIDVYNNLESIIGINEPIASEKHRLYKWKKDNERAYAELQKLIDSNPAEPKYYDLLAKSYFDDGDVNKSIEILLKYLERGSEDGTTHLQLAFYYRQLGIHDKAFKSLKTAFNDQNLDVDFKVKELWSFMLATENNESFKQQAFQLLEILEKNHPENAKVHAIYADYLVKDERYDEARIHLRKVIEKDKSKYVIWEQLLYIESDLKDYEALYKECTEALELFPNQFMLYFFKGIACIELDKYKDAIETLKSGQAYLLDNKQLKEQYFTYLAEAYYKDENFSQSDSIFDKVLTINSKSHVVLNNYSYYLAVRGDSLDKAERMSKICVDKYPDNSTYLDTYAWVLFKRGEYTKAKQYIEHAINNGGAEIAEILEHYGDILFKLNKEDDAVKQWQKALEIGDGSEFLDDKIKTKQLVE